MRMRMRVGNNNTLLLFTSAICIALLSILIAQFTLKPPPPPPTATNFVTGTSSTTSIKSLGHVIRNMATTGLGDIVSLIDSLTRRGHRHHRHHHRPHRRKRRVDCDESRWMSRTASVQQNVSLILTVDQNGCANFSSVQKAVDSVPDYSPYRTLIIIDSGVYR